MATFVALILLLLGLGFAIVGADLLVDGASVVARRFNVSELVIGAVVVGFGTSMPELTVNVVSAVHDNTAIAISNILGSNIFNIFLILGAVGCVYPLGINKVLRFRDLPMNLLAALLVGVCANEMFIDDMKFNALIRSDGLVFLCFFIIFLYYTFNENLTHHEANAAKRDKEMHVTKSVIYIIIGLGGLIAGGELIVQGAIRFAKELGADQHLIGLLIVGPGTSFPELIASSIAAFKKKTDMAVGNIVGSNIFNIFFTLGLTAVIKPIPLILSMNISVCVYIAACVALWAFCFIGKSGNIGRVKGVIFLLAYAVYIYFMLRQ